MQLDKEEVLDLLRKEGKNEYVQKALQELPQKIDHEEHAQMLHQKFGIDPGKLAEKAIEKQLGVTSPSHKPVSAPATPPSTGSTASEPAAASPSTEPADTSATEPAEAPAGPAAAGSAEDTRPPA